jgi:hypothetical protein
MKMGEAIADLAHWAHTLTQLTHTSGQQHTQATFRAR